MKTGSGTTLPVVQEDNKAYAKSLFQKSGVVSENLGTCQEQFRYAMEVYSESLEEASIINRYIEGNHYSLQTLAELRTAKRPAEKHNLILRLDRLLTGYFMKVVTTVVGKPVDITDTETVNLHNEHFKVAQRLSKWKSTMSAVVSDMVTTGLGAWTINVVDTKRRDRLGRAIVDLKFAHINSKQVLPDPRAKAPDKSDGKFIHHWEYLTYEELIDEFGEDLAYKVRLTHQVSEEESEMYTDFSQSRLYNELDRFEYWVDGTSYFIVRTYNKDKNGVITMTSWHGDIELSKTQLDVEMFPIGAIDVLRKAENNRYYSPLWEVVPAQDAINQALLAFQKLVGEERVIADNRAVSADELPALQKKLKTIGDILHVKRIEGLKVVNLTQDAIRHLDKMYTSIQLILQVIGINEAFLGESKAGDSGRKFEGQRSQSENTLNYLAIPIELAYESMYLQCIHYAGVYKQAEEYLRFTDEFGADRWMQINEPFFMPTGNVDEQGVPELDLVTDYKYNHTKGKWEVSFVNEKAKSLSEIAVEIEIHTAPYDDTDSIEMAYIEGLLNGQTGNLIASAYPAGIPYLQSIVTKNLKTRNSEEIAKFLSELSKKMGMMELQDPRLYDVKSHGASAPQQNQGDAALAGRGEMGTQGTNARKIMSAGGTTNDNQPEGYNQPKDNNGAQ